MKSRIKRGLLVFCIAILIIGVGSCICAYPVMTAGDEVIYDFFHGVTESEREEYLKNHENELEYTKFRDSYFLVDCRDITHQIGKIWIYPLSYTAEESFTVNKVSLTTASGKVIYRADNLGQAVTGVTPQTLYAYDDGLIVTYEIDKKWYFVGNKLVLSVEVEAGGEIKELTYDIDISLFWGFVHTA